MSPLVPGLSGDIDDRDIEKGQTSGKELPLVCFFG